jgi:hypothetical protein
MITQAGLAAQSGMASERKTRGKTRLVVLPFSFQRLWHSPLVDSRLATAQGKVQIPYLG